MKSINCKHNEDGAWCKCRNVSRSLFGLGARCCLVYDGKHCEWREEVPKPNAPPPAPTIEEPKPIQEHLTMAISLLALRDEMEKCSNMELYYKLNSCLYSNYPHKN